MALTTHKIIEADYTGKDIEGLVNSPSEAGLSATALKERFDSLVKDLVALRLNALIDALVATTAPSGAKEIGFTPTGGATASNVQDAISQAFTYAETLIGEAVLPGYEPVASIIQVADLGAKFTGTNVETVLAEIFDAIATQITAYNATLDGAISTYKTTDATASKVVVTDSNGKFTADSLASAKLAYLANLSSDVQTQLDGKMATYSTVSDANTALTPGIYSASGSATNFPSAHSYSLLVLPASNPFSTDSMIQIAVKRASTTDTILYYRARHSATWGSWKLVSGVTISTGDPSGGAHGDVWYKV